MKAILNILLIESNRSNVALLNNLIGPSSEFEHTIYSIETLEEAPHVIERKDLDLIVIAISSIPNNPVAAVKTFYKRFNGIPVIVIGDKQNVLSTLELMSVGIQDYLVGPNLTAKELNRSMLYATVRNGNTSPKANKIKNNAYSKFAKLVENQKNYHSLLKHTPLAIAFINQNQEILYSNENFRLFLQNLNGTSSNNLKLFFKGTNFEVFNHLIDSDDDSSKVSKQKITIRPKNGKNKYFNGTLINTFCSKEQGKKYLLLVEDITGDLDQELLKYEKFIAQAKSKAKTDFLTTMSHEIRTPLTAITGYCRLLSDECTNTESFHLKKVEAIQKSSEHLLSLVNGLLDISKIESGQLDLCIEDISIVSEINKVTAIVQPQLKNKQLSFKVHILGKIPRVFRGDSQKVRQILVNLLTNAIKYTESGGIELAIKFVGDIKSGKLIFSISDTGAGIPEEQKDNIFKPFLRGKDQNILSKNGVGLGLYLSKSLALRLGGQVKLVDTSESGTTFEFSLGLNGGFTPPSKLNFSENKYSTQANNVKTSLNNALRGRKILVAEDVENIRELIKNYLTCADAVVTTCENGKKALKVALKEKFDCIVLDLQMPLMSGQDVAKKLREYGYSSPILALTAHALGSGKENGLAEGFDMFLTKPIDPIVFVRKINLAISENAQKIGSTTIIKSVLEGDEVVRENFPLFLAHLKKTVADFKLLLKNNSWPQLARAAHKLKGSAGTYGYPQFAKVLEKLEREIKKGSSKADIDKTLETVMQFSNGIENGIKNI